VGLLKLEVDVLSDLEFGSLCMFEENFCL